MEKEETRLNKEIFFLIAKFLQNSYPELAKVFIRHCEDHHLFPSSVFFNSPSYDQLNNSIYPMIPSNQLIDLLLTASKRYDNPSFLRPLVFQKIPVIQNNKRFLPVKRMLGHTFIVYCLPIDKTSQILITGSDDSLVKVWKLPELSLINTYLEHEDVITNIEIHPSNQYFASSSEDGIICIYSLITGILKYKKKLPSSINDIQFSPCGKYLSVSTKENGLFIWIFDDFLSNKPEYRKWSDSNRAKEMWWNRFTPNSTLSIFATSLNDVYAYHITQKRTKFIYHSPIEINSICINHKLPLKILCILHHSSYFLVFTQFNNYSLFNKKIKLDLGVGHRIVDVQFNCDETLIIALTKYSGVFAWNAESLTITYHIKNTSYLRKCHLFVVSPINPYFIFVANKEHVCSFWDISKFPSQCNLSASLSNQIHSDNINEDVINNEINNSENENGAISQTNNLFLIKDKNEAMPLYSYTLYFKLASISWSPNGEYIIGSDDLQGFTLFIKSTGEINIKTEHQFLLKEKDKFDKAQAIFERQEEIEATNGELEISDTPNQQDENEDDQTHTYSQRIDDLQNILVDAEWNPLIPQPKRWKLHQINLRIKKEAPSSDIVNYESTLARIFRK